MLRFPELTLRFYELIGLDCEVKLFISDKIVNGTLNMLRVGSDPQYSDLQSDPAIT